MSSPEARTDEDPITLEELAVNLKRNIRSIRRDAASGLFPTWNDPILRKGKVTSMAAVTRARLQAARKAEAEFEQRQALGKRRGR